MAIKGGWVKQLRWSPALTVAEINERRAIIPDFPGCYVFTKTSDPLRPDRVFYVGEASTSLRQRLGNYLVKDISFNPAKADAASRREHKGRQFILYLRSKLKDRGLFVRWVEYGGWTREMEATLMDYYKPIYNSRDESLHTAPLLPDELFDPRLLW